MLEFLIILSITLLIIVIILLPNCFSLKKENNLLNVELDKSEKNYENAISESEYLNAEIKRLNKKIFNYEKRDDETNNDRKNLPYYNKRALVGDYMDSSFENTNKILEKLGFKVDRVSSGKDIVNMIKHGYQCDIIFTNNVYPYGSTGSNTLYELKKLDDFHIPVIIHTVSENEDNEFIKEGFDGYLMKPVDIEETKKVLNHIFSNL